MVAASAISPAGDLVLAGTGKTTTNPLAMTGWSAASSPVRPSRSAALVSAP
jgi:hypothetical protein